ncbi:ATP-dependent nuclease, subunit A [Liquorilactobacillus sucicola DSM 21376 = JCM 15457]|uniref:ATP-dependent helicase/nuclease subunit A n=1 Tax=Liquorilactobacillus sucicola DSM 21376 = JCM 15457 TaxID=1423806 RepID=A0A023CY11_9LACO|nr:helicase-exonuclease AddAB subunit AddA [Liquorilactobacillus sucicola]KRN07586.1 atp-dependent deoxyribonuclease, subunit a [Liquorilactobacillus sucicola DSM 21376 = JCM 15457]GAJ26783.1 ATP-dependent nuclease, subunit A [Liquorilactobacillus sucicola DSM 21376 = JCM 15457]
MTNKIKYTPAQKKAITETGKNILVSASAGSGKTRVLVERVIEHLHRGIGVDELLVVTFTEAAAKEMHERIQTTLRAEINHGDPAQKKWYVEQLTKLGTANISTLHAFCLRVIEQYYYVIKLDPLFRLLTDETERELLLEDVWSDLRERLYGEDDVLFEQLTQNFSNDRSDDGLTDLVLRTFDFANAKADPKAWLEHLADEYMVQNNDLSTSRVYLEKVRPLAAARLRQANNELKMAQRISEDEGFEKFTAELRKDQTNIQVILDALDQKEKWNTVKELIQSFKLQRAPRLSQLEDEQKQAKEEIMHLRELAKKAIAELAERYFPLGEAETMSALNHAEALIQKLSQVVTEFMDEFTAEKRRRHILDFNDLEHLTLAILTQDTVESKQVLHSLQNRYHEILIDEYQDTNQLQETILTTIAQKDPGNMFMVGDVKQSIYGFRLADPTLFLKKYHAYAAGNNTQGQRIILAENFRSMSSVTDFTNLVFTQLMDTEVGEMNYDQNAKLIFGAKYYPEVTHRTEILLYETEEKEKTSKEDEKEPFDESFTVDSAAQGQVIMTGQRIKQLIEQKTVVFDRKNSVERELQYRDIVLLVPTRSNNLLITEEFRKLGIPVFVNDAQNYFQTIEIQIMQSFLKIIDNPYQDIPLVSVLRSPLVGLKENQLAFLRINDRTGDYYQAVLKFYQNFMPQKASNFALDLYEKIAKFLDQLERFRTLARQNELAALIWQIYDETGFLDYVGGMPGGAQRQANLHALYERASAYEKTSFKGLFQFLRFVDKMQQKKRDLTEANAQTNEDAVQVMTIHGSKGLEFPLVFLMDATHRFNERSLIKDYILDEQEGVGITWMNPQTRVKIDTLPKLVARDNGQKKMAAEQMRLLYVALTRAEQRLYIVGACTDQQTVIEKWKRAFQSKGTVLNSRLRQETKDFMDWIGMCLVRRQDSSAELGIDKTQSLPLLEENSADFSISFYNKKKLEETVQTFQEDNEDWFKKLAKEPEIEDAVTEEEVKKSQHILEYQYPALQLTKTTAYQAVSEIKRLFNDPDQERMEFLEPDFEVKAKIRAKRYVKNEITLPNFIERKQKITSAQVGTATHLVLQELPLTESPTVDSLQALVDSLTAKKLLTPELAAAVDQTKILKFFKSDLGSKLLQEPEHVKREVPFSLLLPAKRLFTDIGDKTQDVLIHGIIDGYLVNSDKVELFDYKTDYLLPGDERAKQKIIERYKGQLNLYAIALGNILGREVTHKYVYLLETSEQIEV